MFACEPQPVVLEGLAKVLGESAEIRLAGHSTVLAGAAEAVGALNPDIVLVDQSYGLKPIFQFVGQIRPAVPDAKTVLWITDLAEVEVFRALQLGARGILLKTLPVASLLECIRAVAGGHVWIENSISHQMAGFLNRPNRPRLTPRERDIVRFVCRGLKNKQVAEELMITPGTVKVHLMHIFEKTGVKDRYELAIHGRRLLGYDGDEPEIPGPSQGV